MLNTAQIKKYGPAWGAVCAANAWRMARGRLVPEADASRERTGEHRDVWMLAEQHALQQHRSVTVDDLRRGCGAVVTRKFCSTYDLTNKQFTRLLDLFALLIDPDNLTARRYWDHPELREREQVLKTIHYLAPEAYIRELARARFQNSAWEMDATLRELQQFAWTLKQRREHWNRPVPGSTRVARVPSGVAPDGSDIPDENVPF